jgi:hypothetical protein
VKDLREQPWWTLADRAELDVLAHEFVSDLFEHRESCPVCAAGVPPCPWVRAAIERLTEWRDDRMLRSQAAWLRAQHDDQLEAGGTSP